MITLAPRDPAAAAAAAPYTFDQPAYADSYAIPETAMDVRHVYLLNAVLRAWPFASALEVGCFNGASSTAFVEAINAGEGLGESGVATFCDVSVSDSLVDVVRNCRHPDRVRVTPQPSWAVLDSAEPFDFVFVDAAHDLDSVSLELKRLLRRRPLCVMAHDTHATAAGYARCEGAALLAETFRAEAGYRCLDDHRRRDGERTDRGLFFATTDARLHALARAAFERWAT